MNAFPLNVEALGYRRGAVVWMLISEIYWASMLLVSTPAASGAGIEVLTVIIGLGMGAAAWRAGAALADGQRVLETLRTPRTLWHAWLGKVVSKLAMRAALAIICGSVAVMQHGTAWAWSGPLALYAVITLICLMASLAYHLAWHWAWTWSMGAGLAIVMALGRWQALDAWMRAGSIGHLALALACAGVVVSLLRHWHDHPLAAHSTRDDSRRDPVRRFINYAARFTFLNPAGLQLPTNKGARWTGLAVMIPMIYLLSMRAGPFKGQWGDPAGIIYLGSLMVLVSFVHTTVACRDLHWRRLLAPHGFARGRLGWHIIVSTLQVNLGLLAVACAIGAVLLAVLSVAGIRIDLAELARKALPFGAIVAEFLMAICVSAALRTLRRSGIVYIGLFVVAGFLVLHGLTRLTHSQMLPGVGIDPWTNFFVIGPQYLFCLFGIATAATLIANRFWTIQRLLPYIVRHAPQTDEIDVQGNWFPWPGRLY